MAQCVKGTVRAHWEGLLRVVRPPDSIAIHLDKRGIWPHTWPLELTKYLLCTSKFQEDMESMVWNWPPRPPPDLWSLHSWA